MNFGVLLQILQQQNLAQLRIEKKLDETLQMLGDLAGRADKTFPQKAQSMSHPGQHPCALCQEIPKYQKVVVEHDGSATEITIRVCGCKPMPMNII
jgi:hypothetical protein